MYCQQDSALSRRISTKSSPSYARLASSRSFLGLILCAKRCAIAKPSPACGSAGPRVSRTAWPLYGLELHEFADRWRHRLPFTMTASKGSLWPPLRPPCLHEECDCGEHEPADGGSAHRIPCRRADRKLPKRSRRLLIAREQEPGATTHHFEPVP